MSPARDFLRRFRPANAPGRAAAASVPADRAADLATELEPVLLMLADAEAERARILSGADRDAGQIRARARREADDVVAGARRCARPEHAHAAAAAQAGTGADAEAAVRAAEHEVQAIRERTERRLPGYVARVVHAVQALAGDDPGVADAVRPRDEAGRTP
jgi:vacuolar-type H+-ATPase subunit H